MNKMDVLRRLKEKGGKKLSGNERDVKMGLMKDLKSLASDEMTSQLKGLKKVTIAAPNKKGLQEGLEKAEEILDPDVHTEHGDEAEESEPGEELLEHADDQMVAEDDLQEAEGEEMADDMDMNEDELNAKIAELVARKESLKKRF